MFLIHSENFFPLVLVIFVSHLYTLVVTIRPEFSSSYFQNRLNITKTIRKFSIGPDLRPTGSEFQSGPALHNIKHGDEGDEYSGDGSISLTAHNFEKFSHQ